MHLTYAVACLPLNELARNGHGTLMGVIGGHGCLFPFQMHSNQENEAI